MSANIEWINKYGNADETERVILDKFGSPGLIILGYLLHRCKVCGHSHVHEHSLPCSRECLDLINSVYYDHILCSFPRKLLPKRRNKLMYMRYLKTVR
jgi:hypothetical protein